MLLLGCGKSRSRSGGSLDIRAKVGVSSSPTSTGNQAITGVGFQPKVVLPFGGPSETAGSAISGGIIGLGAGLSTSNRASIAVSSNNGVTTSATNRRHDNATVFTTLSGAGSVLEAADLSALGTDGFTLNWTTIDPAARFFNHICLGGADLEVSLTQHQMNGTNAPQSFAHGLSGEPTALILFGASVEPLPVTYSDAGMAIHFYANGLQYGVAITSESNVTTTDTDRYLGTSFLSQISSAGGFIRAFAITSVDGTNVNISYSTAPTGQNFISMLAIRGAKCQTGTFKYGTLSPLTINCAGITPRLFLPIFLPNGVDATNTVMNNVQFTIGASDGTTSCSSGLHDVNAVTTTNTQRWQSSKTLAERTTAGALASEATAAFINQSVVVTPTTLTNSEYGQGAYLIIGA